LRGIDRATRADIWDFVGFATHGEIILEAFRRILEEVQNEILVWVDVAFRSWKADGKV